MSRGYPVNRRRCYNTNGAHVRKLNHATNSIASSTSRDIYRNSETSIRDYNMSSYLADDENYPSFKSQLAKLGLELKDIPPDGNCLFRALGDQLDGSSERHYQHRQQVCDYITKYRADFEPFIEDDVPFDTHIRNLRQSGTYGGNEVIVAFCRIHRVNVVIHQLGRDPWQICDVEAAAHSSDAQRRRQLHIAYHNGDHYSSVRAMGDCTDRPSNIRIPFDPTNAHNSSASGGRHSRVEVESVMRRLGGTLSRSEVVQALEEADYDEDATVAYLLQLQEADNDLRQRHSNNSNSSSSSSLWSKDGTGTRLFGAGPTSERPRARLAPIKRPPAKAAKKERATERRRLERLGEVGGASSRGVTQSDEFIVQGVHAIQI